MRSYIYQAALQILILTALISWKELPDQYRVVDNVTLPSVDYEKNVFMCKLACEADAMIPDVKRVAWNEKVMYLTQQESDNYFIILAKGETLMCCNKDSIIGPLTIARFNELKKQCGCLMSLKTKKNIETISKTIEYQMPQQHSAIENTKAISAYSHQKAVKGICFIQRTFVIVNPNHGVGSYKTFTCTCSLNPS